MEGIPGLGRATQAEKGNLIQVLVGDGREPLAPVARRPFEQVEVVLDESIHAATLGGDELPSEEACSSKRVAPLATGGTLAYRADPWARWPPVWEGRPLLGRRISMLLGSVEGRRNHAVRRRAELRERVLRHRISRR